MNFDRTDRPRAVGLKVLGMGLVLCVAVSPACKKKQVDGGKKKPPKAAPGKPSGLPKPDWPMEKRFSCRADSDCVILPTMSCCTGCGGFSPPHRAANRAWRDALRDWVRKVCAKEKRRCPEVRCISRPPCRPEPRARCRSGKCEAHVVMTGQCGDRPCSPRCGLQPHKAAKSRCQYWMEMIWAHCCCESGGGKDCEYLKRLACGFYDGRCRVPPEERKRRPGLTRCRIVRH